MSRYTDAGNVLRAAILEKYSTVSEFCRDTGFTTRSVHQFTSGERLPSEAHIRQIAGALDLDADNLVIDCGIIPERLTHWLTGNPDAIRSVLNVCAVPG